MDILTRRAPSAELRLRYGPGRLHFGDLRLPSGAGPHPVVLAIHGGFWRALYGLEYFGHACATLTAAGYATWNIEYRRLGNWGGGWPGTFTDVALATDFLRILARSYPLDLARVVTLGHSAGGHLALWTAARVRIPATSPLATPDPLRVHAAVALAGVVDLRRAWELRLSGGVARSLVGGTPERYPERYAAASPIELLPLGLRQTLLHGAEDSIVPLEISARYVAAAQARGDTAELLTLPGVGHFEPVDPASAAWTAVQSAVAALV